jgi:hypothetical protein
MSRVLVLVLVLVLVCLLGKEYLRRHSCQK